MKKELKERNLEILKLFHEFTISTKKLKKEKIIDISESLNLSKSTVKNIIDRYYKDYINEIKNLNLEGLTDLKERFIAEGMSEKKAEYIKCKLFGDSDTQAVKKAGYTKGMVTRLKKDEKVQDFINRERIKVLKKTKYTFQYNYNILGEIADKTKQRIEEREITEKQGGKNGQELSKTVTEKSMYGVGVQAIAQMNKMIGFNFEDNLKHEKLEMEKETNDLHNEKLRRELAVRGENKEDVSITAIRKKYGL